MTDEDAADLVNASTAELRAAFDLFDADGDGLLSPAELQHALASVGQEVTRDEVRQLIASVDHRRCGALDFEGFVSLVEPPPVGLDAEADLREAFDLLDLDGDGRLTAGELRSAVRRSADLAAQEAADVLAIADRVADGAITFDEFRELLKA